MRLNFKEDVILKETHIEISCGIQLIKISPNNFKHMVGLNKAVGWLVKVNILR